MKRALHTFFTRTSLSAKPPTISQSRAEQLNARLARALAERRTLARAQAVADKPLDKTYQQKGSLVANRIDRLQKAIANTKK